jgi:Predicted nucleoside-diphosphate-sugar epimerases
VTQSAHSTELASTAESSDGETILVTGASGFIGRHLVSDLRSLDRPTRCLVRSEARGRKLAAQGCTLARGDMADPASLRAACEGVDTLIHLVAIIRGKSSDYRQVMTAGTRALVEAASAARVRRFILVSALGVAEDTADLTPYYRAKWDEEQTLKASDLEYVILRPSFVFGRCGGVLPTFIRLVRRSPLTPVLGPGTQRIQPVAVHDVASHLIKAVELEEAAGRTFDLVGPDRVNWDQFYSLVADVIGKRRRLVHVPFVLARPVAALFERLPGFPFTRDQLKMLAAGDNVGDLATTRQVFGLPLQSLEEQVRRAAA